MINNLSRNIIILAVILYIITIIVGGLLTPNYTLFLDPISYSVANGMPYRTLLNIGFVAADALILIFTIISFPHVKSKIIRAGIIFLILAALINIIQFIFFPMDPWEGVRTAADKLHNTLTAMLGVSAILAMYLISLGLSIAKKSKFLIWYSYISSTIFTLLAASAGLSLKYFGHYTGIIESSYIILLFQWLAVISKFIIEPERM